MNSRKRHQNILAPALVVLVALAAYCFDMYIQKKILLGYGIVFLSLVIPGLYFKKRIEMIIVERDSICKFIDIIYFCFGVYSTTYLITSYLNGAC